MIPPEQNGSFVAQMEMVLDVYKRPLDPNYPVVCMDESPKQLIAETKVPIPVAPGAPAKHDYEYRRCGVCNIFMACEPLAGKRLVKITERKTKLDWACFIEEIAKQYESAEKITLEPIAKLEKFYIKTRRAQTKTEKYLFIYQTLKKTGLNQHFQALFALWFRTKNLLCHQWLSLFALCHKSIRNSCVAVSAMTPNIRCAITFCAPLTRICLPP